MASGMASGMPDLGAVILAAGKGERLGGVAKALLVSGDRTFLSRIVETARTAGLADAVCVVGPPYGEAVAAAARALGLRVVENPDPARGMASSLALGFAAIAAGPAAAAWLWPVDHAAVAPATLATLVGALGAHAAARPVHGGRGGHPPLVARTLWAELAGCADRPGGARAVLAGADVRDVEVPDPGVVRDVDTRADLARLA